MKEEYTKKECQSCGFIRLGKDFLEKDYHLCKRCYKEAEEEQKIPKGVFI